jgi:hypothetical protein
VWCVYRCTLLSSPPPRDFSRHEIHQIDQMKSASIFSCGGCSVDCWDCYFLFPLGTAVVSKREHGNVLEKRWCTISSSYQSILDEAALVVMSHPTSPHLLFHCYCSALLYDSACRWIIHYIVAAPIQHNSRMISITFPVVCAASAPFRLYFKSNPSHPPTPTPKISFV